MFRTALGRIIPLGKVGGGLGLMGGININDNIAIGYSYDYSIGNTPSNTTEEAMKLCSGMILCLRKKILLNHQDTFKYV